MWKAITQPTKIYAGVSGTVAIPIGCILLNLRAVGNGSIIGIPDGQGNSLTITIPTGTQWFEYSPMHLNVEFQGASGASPGSVWNVVFNGTTSYVIEVMNPVGGF